jgi:hypothetical protein
VSEQNPDEHGHSGAKEAADAEREGKLVQHLKLAREDA